MELLIFHTNDMHNRMKENFLFPGKADLLLDAGDAIAGSNTLFYFTEPILLKMKDLGYDAMAMGNREFHYIRHIMKLRRRETQFPLLSANLLDLTGESEKIISPFLLKEVKGLKVLIIGLTVQILPPGSFWEKIMKFKFLDPIIISRQYINKLKNEVDLIFILSHLGKNMDIMIAKHIPGIHLIIGGHSHSPISDPIKIGNTIIVQAGFHCTSFGRLLLNFNFSDGNYLLDNFKFDLVSMV